MSTQVLTIEQLMERWQVGRAWVTARIKAGELVARDLSRGQGRPNYRIDVADAEAFWNSLKVTTETARTKPNLIAFDDVSYDDFFIK